MSKIFLDKTNRYHLLQNNLGELIALTPEENKKLDDLVKMAQSTSIYKEDFLQDMLASCEDKTLVKFYFDKRFDPFLSQESLQIKNWHTSLSNTNDISFSLFALAHEEGQEAKEKIHLIHHQMSAYCLSEYLKFHHKKNSITAAQASAYLDLACDLGSFKAIVERMRINHEIIKNIIEKRKSQKNPSYLDSVETDALTQLTSDAKRLGNLYWTVGFIHAATILLDVGNIYANEENSDTENTAHALQRMAAENFLRAKEIENYKSFPAIYPADHNRNIIRSILGDEGLKKYKFKSFDHAQDHFLKCVDNAVNPHQLLLKNSKDEVQSWLKGPRRYASEKKLSES